MTGKQKLFSIAACALPVLLLLAIRLGSQPKEEVPPAYSEAVNAPASASQGKAGAVPGTGNQDQGEMRAPAAVNLPDSAGAEDPQAVHPRFPDGAGPLVLADERPWYSREHQEIGKIRTRVVRTHLLYPLVRVVEKLQPDPATGALVSKSRVVTVADHAIVKLKDDQAEATLRDFADRSGFSIRKTLTLPGAYLVAFDATSPDALDAAVRKIQRSGIVQFAEPDVIVGTH